MASRARDKADAARQQIVCCRAGAGDPGSAAEGLFEADGLAGEAGSKFIGASYDGLVDQLTGHPCNHQIAETEFFACAEVNIDTVSE